MRARVTIDLDALLRNLLRVRAIVGERRLVLAVLKGDAYGHGAVEVARTLQQVDRVLVGVAFVEEAAALRTMGVSLPIMVLNEPDVAEIDDAVQNDVRLTLSSADIVPALERAAQRHRRIVSVHIRVDTGFGPPGIPALRLADAVSRIASSRVLAVEGLFTHLAAAHLGDDDTTLTQMQRFREAIDTLCSRRLPVGVLHAANSAGVLRYPFTHLDLVRPGTILYGRPRFLTDERTQRIEAVMGWRTFVAQLAELAPGQRFGYGHGLAAPGRRRVGILPIGYADGLSLPSDHHRDVLVRGSRVPLMGPPSMNTCLVDLTQVPQAVPGDEVVLLGRQGSAEILASDWAASLNTPVPAVWCGIGSRSTRVYLPRRRRA